MTRATSPAAAAGRGLAPERTSLAWSRTGLSLLITGLLVGRLALGSVGPGILVPVALALALAAWVLVASLRRGRWARAVTSEGQPASVLVDGRLPALVVVVVALLCLCELTAVLLRWS